MLRSQVSKVHKQWLSTKELSKTTVTECFSMCEEGNNRKRRENSGEPWTPGTSHWSSVSLSICHIFTGMLRGCFHISDLQRCDDCL